MRSAAQLDFSHVHVLDGGMATELERRGCDIAGPLWSGRVLDESPETIRQVHLDYLRAGADCISTASYQVSAKGYAELLPQRAKTARRGPRKGRPGEDAARALRRSVEIAEEARAEYRRESDRQVWIALSLGPYGAALHNGAEFHGRYNIDFQALVEFHAQRLAVAAETDADLIAVETVPSFEEGRAILAALADFPESRAWVSFTCGDAKHVAHGENLADCSALVGGSEQIVAVGVNCTHPQFAAGLIRAAKSGTTKPVIVYPNSGEAWDAAARRWTGKSEPREYGALAAEWFAAGAQAVGGCCRTTPEHIEKVRRAREASQPATMRQ